MRSYFEEAHVAHIVRPIVCVEGEVIDLDGLHLAILMKDLLHVCVHRYLVQLVLQARVAASPSWMCLVTDCKMPNSHLYLQAHWASDPTVEEGRDAW